MDELEREPTLDEAWVAAEKVLPEGWAFDVRSPDMTFDRSVFVARAWNSAGGGVSQGCAEGTGPTPAAALLALRDRLQDDDRFIADWWKRSTDETRALLQAEAAQECPDFPPGTTHTNIDESA